ncbi:hypothetical protein F2P81_021649 [Scophthalmus maximus]|uniref:Uncharacterized protein n=1 Tax=Scophthalmus maximus TaxID=52904 RepID=A0A6A4S6R1_SCOMX|nr:hypothetical protein F2P81_021649 [Scophthalmus maximus]
MESSARRSVGRSVGRSVWKMDQLSDEEVEVREGEDEEEEDSDKDDQDLDKMFGAWLGELDKLTQSLDDGRPERPPQQKAPLRQETNMANFSYRFSIYNINEALNQGENVDLDALMADLCSIEQELTTVNAKPNSAGGMARLGLTDTKASISMDEAARQTSSHSLSSASTYTSATMRRPGSSQRQHRRTGSVGTVSEHEARSIVHSSRSSVTSASGVSVNSASSMDSLDSALRSSESDGQPPSVQAEGAGPGHHSTEKSMLTRKSVLQMMMMMKMMMMYEGLTGSD